MITKEEMVEILKVSYICDEVKSTSTKVNVLKFAYNIGIIDRKEFDALYDYILYNN